MKLALTALIALGLLCFANAYGGSNSAQSIPTGDVAQTVPGYLTNTGSADSGRVVVKDAQGFAVLDGVGGPLVIIADTNGLRTGPSEMNAMAGRAGTGSLAGASTSTTITFSTPMPDGTYHVSLTSVDTNVSLPTGARVLFRTAAGFGIYYSAAAEATDITYSASDY